jgi:hypothetical protein
MWEMGNSYGSLVVDLMARDYVEDIGIGGRVILK